MNLDKVYEIYRENDAIWQQRLNDASEYLNNLRNNCAPDEEIEEATNVILEIQDQLLFNK